MLKTTVYWCLQSRRMIICVIFFALSIQSQPSFLNTIKVNFGMQGIFNNNIKAAYVNEIPPSANVVDVPNTLELGAEQTGIFFFQMDLQYRRMLGRTIGLIGSIGYCGYEGVMRVGKKKSADYYGGSGSNTVYASPKHIFKAFPVEVKAGIEYLSFFPSPNDIFAFTIAPSVGYTHFFNSLHGYYDEDFRDEFTGDDENATEETAYYETSFKLPGIFAISVTPGFELMLDSYPVGLYLNCEISKYFGKFLPESEIYYRNASQIAKVKYHQKYGIGLKGNIGIAVNFGKTRL